MRKKYKFLSRDRVVVTFPKVEGDPVAPRLMILRRIRALVDIPRYGVKVGDVGGYVEHTNTLSQVGDCWIGNDAVVLGNTQVTEDSFIGGEAILLGSSTHMKLLVTGNAKIEGNAFVHILDDFADSDYSVAIIDEDVHIYGNAIIRNFLYISGSAKIYDQARLDDARFINGDCVIRERTFLRGENSVTSSSEIFGTTTVAPGTIITGNSKIGTSGEALYVPANKKLNDAILTARNAKQLTNYDVKIKDQTERITSMQHRIDDLIPALSDSQTISIQTLDDVAARIEGYQKDIVKIIKYPLMVDMTDPFTSKMMMLFNKAQRLRSFSDNKQFSETVDALEEAFLAAESNALRLSVTNLSEDEKKKTAKATDLLMIAMDDAASDNEKQVAFKQGLKQLEGIILVPENAVETFRVKAGIGQLTA